MKDYRALDGLEDSFKIELRCAFDRGYRQGRDDEWAETQAKQTEDEYDRGLNDAWRVVTEFLLMGDFDRGMTFNTRFLDELLKLEPQNAVERLKLYNEKSEPIERCCKNCKHSENGMIGNSKRCKDCYYDGVSKGNTLFEPMETDIEVGDEVKRADIDKSVVILKFTEEGWALGMNEEGNISDVKLSVYKKTGKHFDQIAEVLNSLKGDIDA